MVEALILGFIAGASLGYLIEAGRIERRWARSCGSRSQDRLVLIGEG